MASTTTRIATNRKHDAKRMKKIKTMAQRCERKGMSTPDFVQQLTTAFPQLLEETKGTKKARLNRVCGVAQHQLSAARFRRLGLAWLATKTRMPSVQALQKQAAGWSTKTVATDAACKTLIAEAKKRLASRKQRNGATKFPGAAKQDKRSTRRAAGVGTKCAAVAPGTIAPCAIKTPPSKVEQSLTAQLTEARDLLKRAYATMKSAVTRCETIEARIKGYETAKTRQANGQRRAAVDAVMAGK